MNKNQVKEIIRTKEENSWNCDGKLCDYTVKVTNLKEFKRYYIANVTIKDQEGKTEKFVNCEYNKEIFSLK